MEIGIPTQEENIDSTTDFFSGDFWHFPELTLPNTASQS
jgi:hypothetical protein